MKKQSFFRTCINTLGGKIMTRKKNPYYNSEGYPDPTAYYGLKPIIKEEKEMERDVRMLVKAIKNAADQMGFEVVGRIHFRHKKSGREFK